MNRRLSLQAAILALGLAFNQACALPTGNQVVAGSAAVSLPTPSSMAITQASDRAILDWASFNIGAAESVRFVQLGANSVALNRVLGAEPSAIHGSLSANGQVFLVNPNGVLFGQNARVDLGGLVGSSLNISNADFLAGKFSFGDGGGSPGTVSNQGRLTTSAGGYVALIAPVVSNAGTLAITPAQLLDLTDPASRSIDQSNPPFTGIVTGFRNGDSLSTATVGTLIFTSTATPTSPVGSYCEWWSRFVDRWRREVIGTEM